MRKLNVTDLQMAQRHSTEHDDFIRSAVAHLRLRTLELGPIATLQFEDRTTVLLQIHDSRCRSVATVNAAPAIVAGSELLQRCNALIPDGSNLKATLRFTRPATSEQRERLDRLEGVERHAYAEVEGLGRANTFASAAVALDADDAAYSSYLLRFEFSVEQIAAVNAGADLGFGIDDDRMRVGVQAKRAARRSLLQDFS